MIERVARAEQTVFPRRQRPAWLTSSVAHVGFGIALGLLATMRRAPPPQTAIVSRVDFDAPPPRRRATPPPPPPREVPHTPSEPAPVHQAATPHASQPARAAHSARTVEAPRVMAAAAHNNSGESMAVGNNGDFHGGNAGRETTPAPPPEPPTPVHSETPRPPPPPPPPAELPDEQLTVHPNIRCNGNAVVALYPQTAMDNDAEADVPVETTVDREGRITRAHARSDPGFGLAAAAERAVLTACRTTAIPRDAAGNAVGTRLIHHIHFQLE